MRTDAVWLEDIYVAIERIEQFVHDAGGTRETVLQSDVVTSAIQYQLIIIGEASSHVSEELKTAFPEIPWREMKSMRNFAVHQYFGISQSILWKTISEHLGTLKGQIQIILEGL